MKTKAETICVLLGGYFVTIIITCIIFLIITKLINLDILNKEFDQGAAIIGLLSWSATIYTVIVATYFFNDWRQQHDTQLIKEQTIDLIKKISQLKDLMVIPLSIKLKYDFEKKYNVGSDSLKQYKNLEFLLQNTRETINQINILADKLHSEILDYIAIIQIKGDLNSIYKKYEKIISRQKNIMEQLNSLEQKEKPLIMEYENLFENFSNEYAEINAEILCELIIPLSERLRAPKESFEFNKSHQTIKNSN